MSKVFKVIVNIIIIVCILSVVALVVPPLVGVEESISRPQMDTNVSEGTVLYGTKLPVSMTSAGDEIVYEGDGYLYLYKINEVDSANGEVHVVNEVSGEQSVLQISKSVNKKVLAVPFIGYIMIATGSKEGIAMLISAAVVLILLALVAELCRKKAYPDEDEEDEEEEEYFSDITKNMETKTGYEAEYNAGFVSAGTDSTAPAAEAAAETAQAENNEEGKTIVIPANIEAAADDAEEKAALFEEEFEEEGLEEKTETAAVKSGATFDFATVMQKEQLEEAAAQAETPQKEVKDQAAEAVKAEETVKAAEAKVQAPKAEKAASYSSEAMEEAFDNVPEDKSPASLNISDDEIPDVSSALVAALATTQVNRSDRSYQQVQQPVEEAPAEPADEIELAIPVRSAEEILSAAYARGEDPGVTKDEVTGVTLIDFSDCLN